MASFSPGINQHTKISPAPNRIHNDLNRQSILDEVFHNVRREANPRKGIKQLTNILESLSSFKEYHLGNDLKWYPRRFPKTHHL
jgi:hypothetical protein